jgi:hypothetical protein
MNGHMTLIPRYQDAKHEHSRLGAKAPPLVGEEVRKRVGT